MSADECVLGSCWVWAFEGLGKLLTRVMALCCQAGTNVKRPVKCSTCS